MKLKKYFSRIFQTLAVSVFFCLAVCSATAAGDIKFNFQIPTIPFPPKIENVTSTPKAAGTWTVTADITGQEQKRPSCELPLDLCQSTDWQMIPDTEVSPNPPEIASAKVYFYKENDVTTTQSAAMTYDAALGKFKADISMSGADSLVYYIVAIDTRGNVASQSPDTGNEPCPSVSTWDDKLSTPVTNSCASATSYTQCNKNVNGTPSPCETSKYTMGDKRGDVCGEPDGNGDQHVITGPGANSVDMLGISAGAGNSVICARIGLAAPPPDSNGPAPIEGYLLIFFNPDLPDPNPADTHIENAFAITYAPEVVGSDPTLVKVLWDGNCVTDPNTSSPLNCKLISAVGANENLKIGWQTDSLRMIVKKSGTGDPLKVPFNLIGSTSRESILVGLTGEINLSGGNAFWISDLTPGFGYYYTNQTAIGGVCTEPVAPVGPSAKCSVSGTGGTSGVCPKSATQPQQNKCKLSLNPVAGASEYRFYRNTTDNAAGATRIASQAGPDYTDTFTTLDGTKYYYFVTSYDGSCSLETKLSSAARTDCTVEDWVTPAAPTGLSAATPKGEEKTCKINWHFPAADVSMGSFTLSRDGVAQNQSSPVQYAAGTLDYNWADPAMLELSTPYTYIVKAIDKTGNESGNALVNCTPEDLKPPAAVSTLMISKITKPDKLGVHIEWPASPEPDVAGYNVFWCKKSGGVQCAAAAEFAPMNPSQQGDTAIDNESAQIFSSEDNYCFYVTACDNCVTSGTCPSNAGAANCSGFPAGGASCLFVDHSIDTVKPAFPATVTATPLPEGRKCKIEWAQVCKNSDGSQLPNCNNPGSENLIGYKIMREVATPVPSPYDATAIGTVPVSSSREFVNTGLANGTTYYYSVYGMDGSMNYSTGAGKLEVQCKPQRTAPPDRPSGLSMDSAATTCTSYWNEVTDQDMLTYNVYRCDGNLATCNNSSKYTSVKDGVRKEEGLTYPDYEVTTGNTYTYCITAKTEDIESAVYTAGNTVNCAVCVAREETAGPTQVTAAVPSGAACGSVNIHFVKSTDDNGTAGGYNIYRCTDATCATKTSIKTCSQLQASSNAIKNISASAPIILAGETTGAHIYGATFQKDCGDALTESVLANNNEAISDAATVAECPPACSNPGKCAIISSCTDFAQKTACSPMTMVDPGSKTDGKYTKTPKAGIEVYLVDENGNKVGESAFTDESGNYQIMIDTSKLSFNTAATYKVVVKLPAAEAEHQPCSADLQGDDCSFYLSTIVKATEDSVAKKVGGVPVASPAGGCAEIGNANCDGSVNLADFSILKNCFGSSSGDGKYQAWADFDGDGTVNLSDFVILKSNYGKAMKTPPTPGGSCVCKQ